MAKAAPQIEWTDERIAAIQEWEGSRQRLDACKSDEMLKRMKAIEIVPFDSAKEEGSQTLKLGAGYSLKLDRPMYYTMDKDQKAIVEVMGKLAATNPAAASALIRWEAVISEKTYKKLTDEEKLILAPVLTIKPGTPSLELTAPAPKKD